MRVLTDEELDVAITAVAGLIYQRPEVERPERAKARLSLLVELIRERTGT